MKDKKDFLAPIMAFMVCTTCITILEGGVGMILYPEQKFGYDAFFHRLCLGFVPFYWELSRILRKN